MFAPICRDIFTLSFEIMVILDWTCPLTVYLSIFFPLNIQAPGQKMKTSPEAAEMQLSEVEPIPDTQVR